VPFTASVVLWRIDPLQCVLLIDREAASYELRLVDGDQIVRSELFASSDASVAASDQWRKELETNR